MSEKVESEENAAEPEDRASDPTEGASEGAVSPEEDPGETEMEEEASGDPGAGDGLTADPDHLQAEFDELNDRHLRLAAEFNNYRRRQEHERAETWGRAQADLIRRFLDVLDDLQRVSDLDISDPSVTAGSIAEGIDLVERKFVRALEESGAEVVAPEEGDRFDPESMEAMMRVPVEEGEEGRDDRVASLFQKGYRLKGHLVRPARVSVYKA